MGAQGLQKKAAEVKGDVQAAVKKALPSGVPSPGGQPCSSPAAERFPPSSRPGPGTKEARGSQRHGAHVASAIFALGRCFSTPCVTALRPRQRWQASSRRVLKKLWPPAEGDCAAPHRPPEGHSVRRG